MKIGFFTPRSLQPLHPRLLIFERYFRSKGLSVEFINQSNYRPNIPSRINWLVLWFFDLYATQRCKKYIDQYDIVFVTDMKYLPLVKYAHREGKIVFYDTIDHNVFLRFYQLERKIPMMRIFKSAITSLFMAIEKRYAFKYCHEIFVNSNALRDYFNKKAITLLYSSPFEREGLQNNSDNPTALLYLGAFQSDKGAVETVKLSQRLNVPLFIYGPVENSFLADELRKHNHIVYTPKISVSELQKHIKSLLQQYFLFGISLIKAAHLSYEIQEANKDIDYLALGIPLIGNRRTPTKAKIDAGCGLFYDDINLLQKIRDKRAKHVFALACREFYRQNFSSSIFNKVLDDSLSPYLKTPDMNYFPITKK